MPCQYRGPWHLQISLEASENASGTRFWTSCIILRETIDNWPSRFNLTDPVYDSYPDAAKPIATTFVSANTNHENVTFKHTNLGRLGFCQSLLSYSSQTGTVINHEDSHAKFSNDVSIKSCTCVYPNDNLLYNKILPSYAFPSLPAFSGTNSNGMALRLRQKIDCDSEDDLDIET